MKNYLSFGGGVNSVALYLLLLEQKVQFEAVYIDHGGDWPETREYVNFFKKKYPLTILKPMFRGYDNIFKYYFDKQMTPSMFRRLCTVGFKIEPLNKYFERPCFVMIGIDYGEQKRAKISVDDGIEKRYPLIEAELDREGCIDLIKKKGLPIPRKSGCFFCPFQPKKDLQELRRKHPDLFCKVETLEKNNNERRNKKGKPPFFIKGNMPIRQFINENQLFIDPEFEYPPCDCGY